MGKERAEAPRRIEEKDLPSIEDGSLAALARSADWRMDSDDGERVWLDLGAKEMEGALDALGRFWADGENERSLGRADVYEKGDGFSGNVRLEGEIERAGERRGDVWQVGILAYGVWEPEEGEESGREEQIGFALCSFRAEGGRLPGMARGYAEAALEADSESEAERLRATGIAESLAEEFLRPISGRLREAGMELGDAWETEGAWAEVGKMEGGEGGYAIAEGRARMEGLGWNAGEEGKRRAREALTACAALLEERAREMGLSPAAITLLGRGIISGEFDGEKVEAGDEERLVRALEEREDMERGVGRGKRPGGARGM